MDSNFYKKEILSIKEYAFKNDISENQVNGIFKECFYLLETRTVTRVKYTLRLLKRCCIIISLLILSIFILYNHPKTHNILLRNLQNCIYPGLRIFRKLAVPITTAYPSLTEWYDEWCLMENPYFEVHEMDCWPCSSVYSVQDLTGYNITPAFNTGIPFKRIEKMDKVDMNNLFQTYIKYKDSFDIDAEQGEFNQAFYRSIHDIMDIRLDMQSFTNGNTHIKWKINRMEPSRKIRELFPKLLGVPDWWSPSTEKFIFIDDPKSSAYELPNPECANVVILCTNGERLIDLNPSTECTQNCQKLSILLKAHQSLWYNWWYWRPISISSVNATATTITYFSSFC